MVERHRRIIRGSEDKRRTFDVNQATPAVERHRLPPRGHHQLAILVPDEVENTVGTFFADLP